MIARVRQHATLLRLLLYTSACPTGSFQNIIIYIDMCRLLSFKTKHEWKKQIIINTYLFISDFSFGCSCLKQLTHQLICCRINRRYNTQQVTQNTIQSNLSIHHEHYLRLSHVTLHDFSPHCMYPSHSQRSL